MSSNQITDWNAYAVPFQSVMPTEMVKLNKDVAGRLYGSVADFGCGSGKLIPYIASEVSIQRYSGIDMSTEMIAGAKWMAGQFPGKAYRFIESRIETLSITPVDSAVSINSFYTWENPIDVLQQISRNIRVGGVFVLATINPFIDMPGLLEEARKEQIANPFWEVFARQNLEICDSEDINLIELDDLVELVRSVGFGIVKAHTDFYGGGLNYLVLQHRGVSKIDQNADDLKSE